MLKILDFDREMIPAARALAVKNYEDARAVYTALPDCDTEPLEYYAENKMGAAAFEDDRLIGFLCATEPFSHAFGSTDVNGIFSPLGTNGIERDAYGVYPLLYAAAALKWVKAGAASHGICLYLNQTAVLGEFFNLGFGVRCRDAIRSLEPVKFRQAEGYDFVRIEGDAYEKIYPLDCMLTEHMAQSPCFMRRTTDTREAFINDMNEIQPLMFAALYKGEPVAFLRAEVDGENFTKNAANYLHIKGSFCAPEHRRRGLSSNLMSLMNELALQLGYKYMGVDYESINPTAESFWPRHFTPYTASVVRRIDEHTLGTL